MPNRDMVTQSVLTLMATKNNGYEDCDNHEKSVYQTLTF